MEAVKFTSPVPDEDKSLSGEERNYQNTYSNSVVVGQVMIFNDSDRSTFWALGSNRSKPPSSSELYIGKHVGEDSDTTRADEVIGYIVIEAGSGTVGEHSYVAGLGGVASKALITALPTATRLVVYNP